jgi:hypothetical protein
MDQNIPRDDASGAQPPADPGSGDAGAWNQAPGQDQSQAAPGSGQEAAAEHAAWSADASYQQQQAAQAQQQQPPQQQAQQPQAAPADTQAYAAPEPQSATYSEQPAPAADPQQQYTQQQYDQAAYAQQQQQYAQQQQEYAQQQQQPQQYGEQQQQPQYYDQSAYGQQQQPQQQQPQYYDQSAYGQQPGYYDQSAYGQQPQQGYAQQPGQPYAYAQPGQDQYWDQNAPGGYRRSLLAVVSAFLLLTWGLVFGITGAFVLWTDNIASHIGDVSLSAELMELVEEADREIFAVGAVLIIVGIIHMIAAVGVFGHRRWGRAFAVVLGILGTLAGLGAMFVAVGFEALDVGFDIAFKGEETSLAASAFVFITYLFILVSMFLGRGHFKKKGVES